MQTLHQPDLLATIEAFLAGTGMGASYFGKAAIGNSEVVKRLRDGGRVWPETEASLRKFMREHPGGQQASCPTAADDRKVG